MGIWLKTGSSTWTQIVSAFMKSGAATWSELISVWTKTATNTWTKIFDKPNIPTVSSLPYINDYLDQNKINNTTTISNVGDTIYGHRGTWNNTPTSYQYKWQYSNIVDGIYSDFNPAQTSTSHPSPLATLVAWDDYWVRYAVKATNATGSSDWILSSNAAHLIKYAPVNNTISISGNAQVNSQLTANSTWSNTNIVTNDQSPSSYSYEWVYGDTGLAAYNNNNSQYYTCTTQDVGHTLIVKITATNTGGSTTAISNPTSTIGQQVSINTVYFTDNNGRTGKNARANLVTNTTTYLNWTVTGIDSSTVFRVRYRVYNRQTGAYYNPNDTVTTYTSTQSGAWLQYEKTYSGSGLISGISTNGSTATLYDVFNIDQTFNGSTYSGGLARWVFQYEISILKSGGTRQYWVYGDTMSSTQTFDYWDIDPTTNPSISASPSAISSGSSTTISGTFNSFPSALSSYPHSYKVDYGDGTNTGWVTLSSGTANQTYSLSKTYSTAGTYTATVSTTPFYTSNSATISVNSFVIPTITNVAYNGSGTVTVTVQNGGPYYQIYWTTITNPSIGASYDAASTTTSISESLTPTAGYSYYFWARSSTQNLGNTTASGTATAGTYSDWSSYYTIRQVSYNYNGGSGTTSLHFVQDSTYVTLPTPSSRTGYTFNGWYDSSSGGTYVGTSGNSYYVTSTLTLYAQWTADTYAVTYYQNTTDSVGSMPSNQTKTYNVTLTLSSNTPTRTNYTFNGWNTNSSGTGTNYAAGASYTTNAALDLYAKWGAAGPTVPTGLSVTAGTVTSSLSTSLVRNSATNKTQSWSTATSQAVSITWTKGTGSGTITSDVKWNQTGTAPQSTDTGTWNGVAGSSQPDSNGGGSTNYYWVRTSDGNGVKSAWVYAGSYTATSPSMTGFSIRIYRGNGTAFSSPSPAPSSTSTSGSYTWAGLTNRDASPDFGHYAWASGTLNGSAKTVTSATV